MDSLSDIDESRRRLLLYLLASGVFSVTGCGSTGNSSSVAPLPAGKSIYRLGGDVNVNGMLATPDTAIQPGDEVTTGERSYVIFVVDKDAFILRSNSTLAVRPATGNAYELGRGKVLSVLATRRTQITTPTAVIGIRGTGIYVESEPQRSYVCTCYGTADLAAKDDPAVSETVVSKHHDDPRYIVNTGSGTARIESAPFKDHTDQELLLIETLVGRTTPFVVPGGIDRSRSTYF